MLMQILYSDLDSVVAMVTGTNHQWCVYQMRGVYGPAIFLPARWLRLDVISLWNISAFTHLSLITCNCGETCNTKIVDDELTQNDSRPLNPL